MSKFFCYCLLACLLPGMAAAQPNTNKIQKIVDLMKKLYSNDAKDYITDGQTIVWVKSYKKWTPDDLQTLKKRDLDGLQFLLKACEHHRWDVLNQLLPDYYRNNGGVQAFADDIILTGTDKPTSAIRPKVSGAGYHSRSVAGTRIAASYFDAA